MPHASRSLPVLKSDMCLDHLALLILVSLSRTTLSEVTIGATKDCEKVTSGQATFPAKFTSFEACCVKEASKLSDAEIKYASKEKCCIPPGAACSQEDGRIPCCNQLRLVHRHYMIISSKENHFLQLPEKRCTISQVSAEVENVPRGRYTSRQSQLRRCKEASSRPDRFHTQTKG